MSTISSDPTKDGTIVGDTNTKKVIDVVVDTSMQGARGIVGPLKSLEENKFTGIRGLKYPTNLGTKKFPHFLKFNINLPAKSNFEKQIDASVSQSVVDRNRLQNGQLQGKPFGAQEGFIAGAVGGAIFTATELLSDIASQIENPTSALDAGKNVTAAALGGTIAGVGTGLLFANLNLTRKTKRLLESISLYIPDQVIMQTENKYGEVSLTKALGTAGLALQAGSAITENFKKEIATAISSNNISGINTTEPFMREAVGSTVGGALAKLGIVGDGFENIFLQSLGYAQNPQIEILFETTDVRDFLFTFNFLPRNKAESDVVQEIIRTFRFHAAPEIVSGGRYYVPPSEFDIEYMFVPEDAKSPEQNKSLHKFSTCVLTSISVNYVGQSGQFVTFKDGSPVNIEMVLRFKETEVIHKQLVKDGY